MRISFSLLVGFIICFILEKFIHWRHCHIIASQNHPHPFSFLILFSDNLHNFIDGLIIGASYFLSVLTAVLGAIFILILKDYFKKLTFFN